MQFTPVEDIDTKNNDVAMQVQEEMNETQIAVRQETAMTTASENIKNELMHSPEVDKLVSTINVNDLNSIVKFGAEAANEVAKASDQVLRSMDMSKLDESSKMLTALSTIMEQFDIKEITEEKKGIFANLRKQLDKILAKYHTMGDEVDKIYNELKGYETEIGETNKKLNMVYESNIAFYKDLCLYILAGERACSELDDYIADYRTKAEADPDSGAVAMNLQTLEQTRSVMEQRVMDLKIAENVAMQSIPMLKTMEFSNLNLIRKINSAFIITMPVFKQALAQAIMLKRQRIQADAMSALDEKTNELLIKNAQNTVSQSKMIAQMANGSSIKVETLEKTWATIVQGIEDTKRIQDEARNKRKEDSVRLQKLKDDYAAKMNNK